MNLAARCRPGKFDELVGQDVLVRVLKNSFSTGTAESPVLMVGASGVGKTTCARIISLCLNCCAGPTCDPCGVCEHCLSIKGSYNPDVIEIDAASNTGVDDIRAVLENSRYLPAICRFKVYIIDEVHMLSVSAFNALLKTLEDPSPHVRFVLATTEVKKVPATVISRCHRFDLKKLTIEQISHHLEKVSDREKMVYEKAGLKLIAENSSGSLRNALFLLEQSFIYTNNNITLEKVMKLIGCIDRRSICNILQAVFSGEPAKALQYFREACSHNSTVLVLENVLSAVYELSVSAVDRRLPLDCIYSALTEDDKAKSPVFLARMWQVMLKGIQEVKCSEPVQQSGEMLILRLCYLSDLPSPKEVIERLYKERDWDNSTISSKDELIKAIRDMGGEDVLVYLSRNQWEISQDTSELLIQDGETLSDAARERLEGFVEKAMGKSWVVRFKKKVM